MDFSQQGRKEYPDGTKITKYTYARMSSFLSDYGKMMSAKVVNIVMLCSEELWSSCDTAKCGFTKAFWGAVPEVK